jgi:uncharacterized protein (DUF305 family)
MTLRTCFRHPTSLALTIASLIVALTAPPVHTQQMQMGTPPASRGSTWSELQQSMQSMHELMSSLESSGNDDEDFVRLMLPHHQAALDMAKVELMHGQDPQMRRLAQEIITDQESEIELMNIWIKQHGKQRTQPTASSAKEHSYEAH